MSSFKILSIDTQAQTMLIDWGTVTLNHNIPLYILEHPDLPEDQVLANIGYMRPAAPVDYAIPEQLLALVEPSEPVTPDPVQELDGVLVALFNQVAAERRYDSWITCSLRAGGNTPFKAEGETFLSWMDACNLVGYDLMAAVKAGTRSVPTAEEFIALMPVIEWPPSPVPEGAI